MHCSFPRLKTPISDVAEATYERTSGFLSRGSQVRVLPGAVDVTRCKLASYVEVVEFKPRSR